MKLRFIISFLVFIAALAITYFDAGAMEPGTMFAILPLIPLDFEGEDNLPGLNRAYVIKTKEIETEAKPIPNPTTALDKITIDGSHTLVTDAYFVPMYSTLGKGTLKFDAEGSRDFENFKVTGMLFYPSTKKEALAMATALLGQDLIIMGEENSEADHFLQVGTKKLSARIVSSGDWGTELNGEKGITFNFEAFHGKATPYIYDGSILIGAANDVNPPAVP